MRKFKVVLAGLAVASFVAVTPVAQAHEAKPEAVTDPVVEVLETAGCAAVTLLTLPIAILSSQEPGCRY